VPLTGERVREWIEKETALMRLVVEPPPGWTADRTEFPVEGVA